MRTRSYNAEIRTATAQVLDVFNDIIIDRRDSAGIKKLIRVPCVYGNRSRILKSLENKNKTFKVPMVVIRKESLNRDTTRVADINNGLFFQSEGSGNTYNVLKNRPQPMNIDFELSIITRYEDDMDQIISNFMPMMSPDFYVAWPNPRQPGKNLKSQVVWDGSINYEWPTDISETEPYRIIATTMFTYKTWIFPGLPESVDDDGPLIHKINYCPNLLSVEDGNYMLDRWYDVPYSMTLDEYQDMIVCGMIKMDQTRENWDWFPMSGAFSGTWQEVSSIIIDCCPLTALVSGSTLSQLLSGDSLYDLTYLWDDEGNLLLLGPLPECIYNK